MNLNMVFFTKVLALIAGCMTIPAWSQTYSYDFVWYSGATRTWVYEAGPMLTVDVYEDLSTPENDVLFRIRNEIYTELGYESSVADLQIDTGTETPDMLDSVSISLADSVGDFRYRIYTPGSTKTLIDLTTSRIAWSGEFAAGRTSNGSKLYGINPGEYIVFRAQLKDGFTFAEVIDALNVGMSSSYVSGHYGQWTRAQKAYYRAEATKGLRIALLLQSIVPNSWHRDGHGLFVTHRQVESTSGTAPRIIELTAAPSTILDTGHSQLSVIAVDPDGGPEALSYQWEMLAGGGTLYDATSANALYYPDDVTGTQTVTIRVSITDGESTVSREVTLTVQDANPPVTNTPPEITALTATPSTILDTGYSQLSVTAIDSDGGPEALTFQWLVVSGSGTLYDATTANPLYYPTEGATGTTTIQVTVTDGEASVTGDLTLTVQDSYVPPPGAQLLVADFNTGGLEDWRVVDEGTRVKPSKWRIVSGELAQLNNIYGGSTSSSALDRPGTYLIYPAGALWDNYRVRFKMRTTDDDGIGLMFRIADPQNFYRFSWDRQLNERRLVKRTGDTYTLLAADTVPYEMGRNYQVEIIARDGQLEVWIDQVNVFRVTDTSHPMGTIAFYTWRNNGAYFDDLVVEAIQ